jgi:hypothetical protein
MSGSVTLVGVINHLRTPQLPVTAFKLLLFNRWTAGFGEFRETVRLIGPDQATVIKQGDLKFALRDVTHNATNVSFWGQIKFDVPGAYTFEIMVDDVMKLRFPMVIELVPPPGAPAEGGAKRGP